MKNYSFYQYVKTRAGENSGAGELGSFIIDDPAFPKYAYDYEHLSDYLEKNPYPDLPLTVFDDTFLDYQNWLNY